MFRTVLVFISSVVLLLASCATTGGSVLSENRTADVIEALTTEPDGGKKDLALELPFADTVRNTPQPVQTPAEPVMETSDDIEEAQPPVVVQEEVPAEPVPAVTETTVEESVIEEVPVAEEILPPETAEDIPVPEISQPVAEETLPTAEEPAVVQEATEDAAAPAAVDEVIPLQEEPISAVAPVIQPAADFEMPPTMSRLIIDGMIASVVIVIMFTVATAIRSAYKMPLSRLLSVIIAVLISFLPFVICIIIGGLSNVWFSYFLLLFSFFIFRSGKGRRGSR